MLAPESDLGSKPASGSFQAGNLEQVSSPLESRFTSLYKEDEPHFSGSFSVWFSVDRPVPCLLGGGPWARRGGEDGDKVLVFVDLAVWTER